MVVDSSALIAVLLMEPGAEQFLQQLAESEALYLSPASLLETAMVIEYKKGKVGADKLDELLAELMPIIVPFDHQQALLARTAWREYGKGRHPAKLNFGDCCSYALAKQLNKPLLFKGNDFSQTDLLLMNSGD
ncbi:type II toxin-antitoxin system VapC family toxin [Methylomonas rivi]|uniref:Ribonuclease VapC n=1 Tax=Methylomonas rivi TaxID=2952226 RepID=A0ABT1U170_9GAMM|nr:type II toxin-antitoxin system VapC family toxin [Methylomonas sp. WSC-6]MCQ8127544.1 type II toxin-antitoxin system VapC family toxin [Methylomonas sp. WSC-6]